jgi:hypothetical protein
MLALVTLRVRTHLRAGGYGREVPPDEGVDLLATIVSLVAAGSYAGGGTVLGSGAFSQFLACATLVRALVAVVSTVQVRLAGVASELQAVSVALTSKAWEPSGRYE